MKIIVALSLFMMALMPLNVMAQNNLEAEELSKRLVLAKQYFEIFPMEDEIKEAIDQLVLNVPKSERVLFKTILERHIKIPRILAVSEMALAEIFTQDELRAMVAFYSTDEGKAIREKMPLYRQATDPILEQMVSDAVESYEGRTPSF